MSCPNTTAHGCRCPQHEPGLAAYATDQAAYEAMLAPLRQPVTLRIVTPGPLNEPTCDGTMTCPCRECVKDRVNREPTRASEQPWVPRPARRAA